jgi:hypothetical protein
MEAKLPDNCQLSIIIWQLFFLRIPAKRIEHFSSLITTEKKKKTNGG